MRPAGVKGTGRGLCKACYLRWYRTVGKAPRTPPEDRFWAKVNKDGPIPEHRPDLGPCWIWTGAKIKHGYGHFRLNRKSILAHRVAYEWLVGPIPEGLEPDHLCRVPSCVNPGHIEPVTQRENVLRGTSFAALNARKTHCPHGHEYTPENTRVQVKPNGARGRFCRACSNAKNRRRYWQQKNAKLKESK
jgi:hypothetical protein